MPGRAARSWRQTSMPSSRGSIRSSTTRSNGSRRPGLDARGAVADRRDLVAVALEQIDDAVAQAGFVFDHEDAHALDCVTLRRACKGRVRLYSQSMRRVWLAVSCSCLPSRPPSRLSSARSSVLASSRATRRSATSTTRPPIRCSTTRSASACASASRSGSRGSYPELELGFAPTHTSPLRRHTARADASTSSGSSRALQLRIELMPKRRIEPFLVVGGGSPIAFSSARKTFNTGIIGDGYVGARRSLRHAQGLRLRLDARFAVVPGVDATASSRSRATSRSASSSTSA